MRHHGDLHDRGDSRWRASSLSAAACGDGREAARRESTGIDRGPRREGRRSAARADVRRRRVVKARTTAQISSRIAAELQEIESAARRPRAAGTNPRGARRSRSRRPAFAGAGLARRRGERRSIGRSRTRIGRARVALAREHHRRIEQLREQNSATPAGAGSRERRTADGGSRRAGGRREGMPKPPHRCPPRRSAIRAAEVAARFQRSLRRLTASSRTGFWSRETWPSPGVPILTIETTDGFRLEVQIDAARARFVGIGDTAAVDLDRSRRRRTPSAAASWKSRAQSILLPTLSRQSAAAGRRAVRSGVVCARALHRRTCARRWPCRHRRS